MVDARRKKRAPVEEHLQREVERRAERHRRAQGDRERSIWFSLSLFGLVGWSIAVPTVLGALLGAWIDHRRPGGFSWTLTLMFVGAVIGCFNAWKWIRQVSREE